MARPKKIGLGYFPLDCQMDDKVEMLEAEHGLEGFAVYIKLLQAIYQTETGELDMSIIFRWKTLGKQYGILPENLRNMVDTMLEVSLFDKDAFQQRQILTSSGIQKRIAKVSGLRDRDRERKIEGFPDGKHPENLRKSAQKEKEKEKEKEIEGKPSTALRAARKGKQEPEHFAAFWQVYPRKEARAVALKAFEKLEPEEQAAAAARAQEWFGRRAPHEWYKSDGTDVRPHPATWLNQKRWTDLTEVSIIPPTGQPQYQQPYGNAQRNAIGQQHGLVNHEKRDAAFTILGQLGL